MSFEKNILVLSVWLFVKLSFIFYMLDVSMAILIDTYVCMSRHDKISSSNTHIYNSISWEGVWGEGGEGILRSTSQQPGSKRSDKNS